LINSEKASTSHVFNEYIERFLRFRFSMIQTHDRKTHRKSYFTEFLTCCHKKCRTKM